MSRWKSKNNNWLEDMYKKYNIDPKTVKLSETEQNFIDRVENLTPELIALQIQINIFVNNFKRPKVILILDDTE